MGITVSQIAYAGWPNCYRVSDGAVEAIVTADVGPRVIRCGFNNGPNLFGEFPEQAGLTGGEDWRIYGGHRLWHSPESKSRTYVPDNDPVTVAALLDGLRLTQAVEASTGIRKELQIRLNRDHHTFRVTHLLTNVGCWPVTLAPWGVTVMRTGGVAILPQNRASDAEGLLPNRILALWPYTEMNDPRITWGSRFILLRQDPERHQAFKIGLSVPQNWAGYLNDGFLFLKRFAHDPAAAYPDGGVNVELYTNDRFLELETLGPLTTLAPGESVEAAEEWELYRNLKKIRDENDVEQILGPEFAGG